MCVCTLCYDFNKVPKRTFLLVKVNDDSCLRDWVNRRYYSSGILQEEFHNLCVNRALVYGHMHLLGGSITMPLVDCKYKAYKIVHASQSA